MDKIIFFKRGTLLSKTLLKTLGQNVVVDTGITIAFLNKNEPLNKIIQRSIVSQPITIYLSDWTIIEVYRKLRESLSQADAISVMNQILTIFIKLFQILSILIKFYQ